MEGLEVKDSLSDKKSIPFSVAELIFRSETHWLKTASSSKKGSTTLQQVNYVMIPRSFPKETQDHLLKWLYTGKR